MTCGMMLVLRGIEKDMIIGFSRAKAVLVGMKM